MAKKNGKAKGKQREVQTFNLAMMPLPEGDFGKAEAEAWLDEQLDKYQCLVVDARDPVGVLASDVVAMVKACRAAMQGSAVRFQRISDADTMARDLIEAVANAGEVETMDIYARQLAALARTVVAMFGAVEQEQLAAVQGGEPRA